MSAAVPAPGDGLKEALERVEVALTSGYPELRDLVLSQVKAAVLELGKLGEDSAERGARILQEMAASATHYARGEIDAASYEAAQRRFAQALRLIGDRAMNAASVQAYTRAKRLMEGALQIALGVVSAGLAVVAPAVGSGVAAALGAVREAGDG